MSKELVIGSNRHETKVAILEDDQLAEVYFQRGNEYSLAGSIHKGRVTRVLPGMQSAFVDLGLERDTFLYVSDFFEEHEDFESLGDDKPDKAVRERRDRGPVRNGEPREVRPFIVEPPARAAEVAEEVVDIPETEFKPAVSAEAPAVKTAESGEADRFSGNRRGRRSRRRRQRGRGFPENKYAQPVGPPAPREAPFEATRPEEPREQASDVIMLPGESLAKYQRRTDAPEKAKAIETEAEEIELTDKVLGHHDDESVEDVEEKIEEVKEDQPVPASDNVSEVPEVLDIDEFEGVDLEDIPLEDM